jgi:hypothetical protein
MSTIPPDLCNNHDMAEGNKTTGNKRGPKEVTAAHKAAMQSGRAESKAVREYLEALVATKPKRGRKRTPDSINKRMAAIAAEMVDADPLTRLNLVQERMNLETELAGMGAAVDISGLEQSFVAAARAYGERRGISYAAWRALGVEASVLGTAGITR